MQSGSDSVPSETKQTEVGNEDSDVPGDTGALEDETENGASGEGVLTGIDDGNGETPNGNEGDETPSGETSGGSDDDKHSDKAPDVDEDDRLVEVLIPDNGNDDSSEGKTEVSNIENGDDNSGDTPGDGNDDKIEEVLIPDDGEAPEEGSDTTDVTPGEGEGQNPEEGGETLEGEQTEVVAIPEVDTLTAAYQAATQNINALPEGTQILAEGDGEPIGQDDTIEAYAIPAGRPPTSKKLAQILSTSTMRRTTPSPMLWRARLHISRAFIQSRNLRSRSRRRPSSFPTVSIKAAWTSAAVAAAVPLLPA